MNLSTAPPTRTRSKTKYASPSRSYESPGGRVPDWANPSDHLEFLGYLRLRLRLKSQITSLSHACSRVVKARSQRWLRLLQLLKVNNQQRWPRLWEHLSWVITTCILIIAVFNDYNTITYSQKVLISLFTVPFLHAYIDVASWSTPVRSCLPEIKSKIF